jgi:hypothetical protein
MNHSIANFTSHTTKKMPSNQRSINVKLQIRRLLCHLRPVLQLFKEGLIFCEISADSTSKYRLTATVESDFSVLSWEKDEHRKCLSDLALEGIMQSKQFELLSNLVGR